MNMKVVSLFKIKSLLLNKNEKLLNKDQLQVYNSIITALQSESPLTNTFFVDGPCGSIKNVFIKVRSSNKIALAVASSGIAAAYCQEVELLILVLKFLYLYLRQAHVTFQETVH